MKTIKFEEWKEIFASKGCELLETAASSWTQQLKYRCRCGNVTTTTIANMRHGRGCKQCVILSQRRPFDEVKAEYEAAGYKLLATSYVNANVPMEYVCPAGHKSKNSYSHFRRGQRCKICTDSRMKNEYEEVKAFFTSKGCELLETSYIDAKTPMSFKCWCGRISKIDWNHYRRYKGQCRQCSHEGLSRKMMGPGNHQWVHDRIQFAMFRRMNGLFRRSFHQIWSFLHNNRPIGPKTADTIYRTLGYDHEQLAKHLESFSSWASLKDTDWHLDHIFPIVAFLKNGIFKVKIINSLDNLQPLSEKDNLSKNDKYDPKEFSGWLKEKHCIELAAVV